MIKCPSCGVQSRIILLNGKQAICNNIKCTVDKFTNQDYKPGEPTNEGKKNKSYNNSGR